MEIWKDIKGYEGMYQISSLGRVKSLNYKRSKKERIMKFGSNNNGYLQIVLHKNGTPKTFRVHRLVAEAFISNPLNKETVNHIDENKTNNNVKNLEWMTIGENNRYGTKSKRTAITNSKPIYGINLKSGLILEFQSSREAERNIFQRCNIKSCLKGINNSHKGFKWFYKEEN